MPPITSNAFASPLITPILIMRDKKAGDSLNLLGSLIEDSFSVIIFVRERNVHEIECVFDGISLIVRGDPSACLSSVRIYDGSNKLTFIHK